MIPEDPIENCKYELIFDSDHHGKDLEDLEEDGYLSEGDVWEEYD